MCIDRTGWSLVLSLRLRLKFSLIQWNSSQCTGWIGHVCLMLKLYFLFFLHTILIPRGKLQLQNPNPIFSQFMHLNMGSTNNGCTLYIKINQQINTLRTFTVKNIYCIHYCKSHTLHSTTSTNKQFSLMDKQKHSISDYGIQGNVDS